MLCPISFWSNSVHFSLKSATVFFGGVLWRFYAWHCYSKSETLDPLQTHHFHSSDFFPIWAVHHRHIVTNFWQIHKRLACVFHLRFAKCVTFEDDYCCPKIVSCFFWCQIAALHTRFTFYFWPYMSPSSLNWRLRSNFWRQRDSHTKSSFRLNFGVYSQQQDTVQLFPLKKTDLLLTRPSAILSTSGALAQPNLSIWRYVQHLWRRWLCIRSFLQDPHLGSNSDSPT